MGYQTAADITVDASGDPEDVVTTRFCRRIRVQQLITEAEVQFFAYGPGQTTNGKRRFEGSEHIFESLNGQGFQPGETVGRLATASGSAQFTREMEW